jgi:tetratricopeptide (TPR) repeat protein
MKLNFFRKNFFPAGWLETWRPYFFFFIVVFAVYGQALFFGLTYLDDNALIIDKFEIISHLKNILTIFSTDVFLSDNRSFYRPLLNMSFMVDAQFGSLNYAVYHLTNLLWHLVAGSLVFLTLKRLSRRPSLAFVLTLLFLVHPALAQAVAWLPGRNDSIVAVFVMLAFWFFLNFVEHQRLSSFLAYLGFLGLALLSKETAALLPLLLIVYFFTLDKEKQLSWRDRSLIIIGSGAVGFIWYLLRSFVLNDSATGSHASLASILTNLPAALTMSTKLFLPFNLSVFPTAADTSWWLTIIAWPIIIVAFILARRKDWRPLFFGLAWFLIFLLPSLAVYSGAPFLLEHRLYLPFIGLLIALSSFSGLRDLVWSKRLVWLSALIILGLFSAINIFHSRDFRDSLTFWRSAVHDSPHSPMAQRNLGAMYYLNDQPDEAARYYQAALDLNPKELMAHNNLGVIYLDQNKLIEAAEEFKKELALNPRYDKSLFTLGEVYFRQNNLVEARYYWQEALRINPNYSEPYLGLLKLQKKLNSSQTNKNNVK